MASRRNDSPVDTAIATAYTEIICEYPFFATVLLHLEKVEDKFAPTMWTDGKRLGYNPDFVMRLSDKELIGVLVHEVSHVVGLHPFRRGGRGMMGWNIACDKVVNNIVKEAGLQLPAGCIPPVPDKSAEELYVDIPEPPPMCGGGGDGDGDGDGNDQQQQQPPTGGAPGKQVVYDPGCGEVRDAVKDNGDKLSPDEMAQREAEAKIVIQQAVTAGKRAGTIPAGLARLIDEAMEPRVPWKEILNRFLDQFVRNDYCWQSPNRKYMQAGFYVPGLKSPAYGKVIMANDTSGSIDNKTLTIIAGELLHCMDLYTERGQDPELTVAWFDHDVYPQTVTCVEDIRPMGGGGTSYRVIFDWMRRGTMPKGVIITTDGECGDFGKEPDCPVLWVLTQANSDFKPPFGEIACVMHN